MTKDALEISPYLPCRVIEGNVSRMRSPFESGLEVVAPFIAYCEMFGLRSVSITVRSDLGNAYCPDVKPLG
jgi:hypothetical protein